MPDNIKYRLKFMFQQIDLTPGTFVIGRSPECNLTLEDPLVSRAHARIHQKEQQVRLEDLSSRNGTFLNGVLLSKNTVLKHNDRIRIGNHDLVFLVEQKQKKSFRTTGAMMVCPSCHVPMAIGSAKCPHCDTSINNERSKTDHFMPRPDATVPIALSKDRVVQDWTRGLVMEVIEKAIQSGQHQVAARSLDGKRQEFEKAPHDIQLLEQLSKYSLLLAEALSAPDRVHWVIDMWTRQSATMPRPLFESLTAICKRSDFKKNHQELENYVEILQNRIIPQEEIDMLVALLE